jgi:hypothetical protein
MPTFYRLNSVPAYSLGVYGIVGLGAYAATRGGSKAKENAAVEPKLNSSS